MSLEIIKSSVLDSGSGTTVNLVELPLGLKFVRKDYNLPGSEKLTFQTLIGYQKLTQRVSKVIEGSNLENWHVNPILFVGQAKFPFTICPYVEGISSNQLINTPSGKLFRLEFNEASRLLRFTFPYERIKLIALNITLTPRGQFIITNLREYVDPTKHPIQLFRRHRALSN